MKHGRGKVEEDYILLEQNAKQGESDTIILVVITIAFNGFITQSELVNLALNGKEDPEWIPFPEVTIQQIGIRISKWFPF